MARRRFVRPAKSTKIWFGSGVGGTAIATGTKTFVGSLNAAALALRPFTILRTRMDVLLSSDQTGAAEDPRGSLGFIVVTETATGVGVTAIPDPSPLTGEPNADWFVHQAMSNRFTFISGVGIDANAGSHYTIDSKAMRKVGDQDDLALMFTMDSAFGGILVTAGRMLVQLH